MGRFLKKLKQREDGVFTLEATILFPIILIITMTFIIFSIVIYQKAMLTHSANTVAERLAFVWDNSYKDINSGEFDKYPTFDGGDGLYWRMFDNQYLSKFGLDNVFGGGNHAISLASSGGGDLPSEKLGRASADTLPPGATGEVRYENGLLGSQIIVEMKSPLDLPKFVRDVMGLESVKAEVSHAVIEPPEFIRSTDLIMYAFKKIKKNASYITKYRKNNY